MSMIAVHGPYTFGSKGITEQDELIGTVNPTNGLIWDFRLDYPSTRSNQDFSWAFPTDGTPTPQVLADPAAVTYATPGSKTVTLTVTNTARATVNNRTLTSNVATLAFSAPHGFAPGQVVVVSGAVGAPFTGTFTLTTASGTTITYPCVGTDVVSGATTGTVTSAASQYPSAGTHTITVTAVTGTGPPGTSLRRAPGDEEGEITQELPVTDEPSEEVPVGYDPAAHTVGEVQEYVSEHPDQLEEMYEAEVAGKARSTLVTWLEEQFPYDPGAWTVQEVVDYAEANPGDLDDIIAAEQAGKNRSTLLSHLEGLRSE